MLDIVCIICSEPFTETHEVYITNCGHLFDYNCLTHWMSRSRSCPQCRKYCTEAHIHKVFFTLSESLPSTSTAQRIMSVDNDLQNADDEDLYDLLLKADEVIRILAETDYEEIETIFALKEKVQEKEGTIMSYVEEVNRLNEEIAALQVKVSSIESERERCEYKGTDLNNIMGTLKCDLQTESEIRKERELRLVQMDTIFLSPPDGENVRNEVVADVNRNNAERPTQLENAAPIATRDFQAMTGELVTTRNGVERAKQVTRALPIGTPDPEHLPLEGERPEQVRCGLAIVTPAPPNPIRQGMPLTTRQAEELRSGMPSTLLSNEAANRISHWVGGFQIADSVRAIESDGSLFSSDTNSRSFDTKQLLHLAKDRARSAGWKFVWRKYGQILARKEEFSKVIRIKNVSDLNRIE